MLGLPRLSEVGDFLRSTSLLGLLVRIIKVKVFELEQFVQHKNYNPQHSVFRSSCMQFKFEDVRMPSNAAIVDNAEGESINAVDIDVTAPNGSRTVQSNFAEADHVNPTPIVPPHAVEEEDIPPDGGYGWICTACVFLINANTWGVNSAWGIFLAYYLTHSTFSGASQFEYALIGGLSISQALLISPLVAASNRKLGTRATLLIGTCLVSTAWLGASFATRIWHLFLTVGTCFGYGMGFLYITASAVLPQWFSTQRSLAVGIASAGAGLGGLAYNLGAGAAVETLGLKWTYRVLAICSFMCNFICSIVLKDRNRLVKPTQSSFDYRELGRVEVDLVISWGFLTELGYIVLLYSLPHYATSIELSQKQGSIIGAMLNFGLAIGRPLVGYYSDAWGRINMATATTALCGLFCLAIWMPANSFSVLTLFAVLSGTVCGTFWSTVTAVTEEVVGLKRLPSTFGIVCVALVLPTTFAESVALGIVSASGYRTSQIFVGFAFLLGALCTWVLRSWKIDQIKLTTQNGSGEQRRPDQNLQWLGLKNLFSPYRI
jgi:MFS family permease